MNKRGQFYIIIAIIISLALITITTKVNRIKEPILFENFEALSDNYIVESKHLVNYALYNKKQGGEIKTEVDNFTSGFLSISRQYINPSTQILYVYSNGTNLSVGNYFNDSLEIENSTLLGAEQEVVEEITLNVGGIDFINQIPVKAKNFGQEWYTLSSSGNTISLSIGGIAHNFKIDSDKPTLKAIIRTSSGSDPFVLNLGGNSSVEGGLGFSPDQNTGTIQQRIQD